MTTGGQSVAHEGVSTGSGHVGHRPIDGWVTRLLLSIAIVGLLFFSFALVAHLVDPRWPPLAYGGVRTAVRILTWPGTWIGASLVVTRMNPFPPGWGYASIWIVYGLSFRSLIAVGEARLASNASIVPAAPLARHALR